jgi:hypothetical protein
MPITLNKIANNSARVAFEFAGDTINLEYFPGRITEKLFAQLASFAQMNEASVQKDINGTFAHFSDFNGTFCKTIKSWDVYEDDKQTILFPLVPERIEELPFSFRTACIDAIVADMRPKKTPTQK